MRIFFCHLIVGCLALAQGSLQPQLEKTFGLGEVKAAEMSSDGRTVVTGGILGVFIWDAQSQQLLDSPKELSDEVWGLSISHSGQIIASIYFNETAKIYDIKAKKVLYEIEAHPVFDHIKFGPTDEIFAVWSEYKKGIRIYRTSDGQLLREITREGDAFDFSPDGKFIVTLKQYSSISVWNVSTGSKVIELAFDGEKGGNFAFSSDSRRLAFAGLEGITLWSFPDLKELGKYKTERGDSLAIVFGPDSKTLFMNKLNEILAIDLTTMKKAFDIGRSQYVIDQLEINNGGSQLFSFSDAGDLLLWNVQNRKIIGQFNGHTPEVQNFRIPSEGRILEVYHFLGWLKRYDLATGLFLDQKDLQGTPLNPGTWNRLSPDGKIVATTSFDQLYLLNAQTGKILQTFKTKGMPSSEFTFSNDGKYIAAGEQTVRIWNVSTGRINNEINIPGNYIAVTALALGGGNGILALGLQNGKTDAVGLWELGTNKMLLEIKDIFPYEEGSYITSMAFSPDENTLAVGYGSKIYFLDRKGTLLGKIEAHKSSVEALYFTEDSVRLISGGRDGVAKIWKLR